MIYYGDMKSGKTSKNDKESFPGIISPNVFENKTINEKCVSSNEDIDNTLEVDIDVISTSISPWYYEPSDVSCIDKFITLSPADRRELQIQKEIWLPNISNDWSFESVKRVVSTFKSLIDGVAIVCRNPSLTESRDQRKLYRREVIDGMFKHSKPFKSSVVPKLCGKIEKNELRSGKGSNNLNFYKHRVSKVRENANVLKSGMINATNYESIIVKNNLASNNEQHFEKKQTSCGFGRCKIKPLSQLDKNDVKKRSHGQKSENANDIYTRNDDNVPGMTFPEDIDLNTNRMIGKFGGDSLNKSVNYNSSKFIDTVPGYNETEQNDTEYYDCNQRIISPTGSQNNESTYQTIDRRRNNSYHNLDKQKNSRNNKKCSRSHHLAKNDKVINQRTINATFTDQLEYKRIQYDKINRVSQYNSEELLDDVNLNSSALPTIYRPRPLPKLKKRESSMAQTTNGEENGFREETVLRKLAEWFRKFWRNTVSKKRANLMRDREILSVAAYKHNYVDYSRRKVLIKKRAQSDMPKSRSYKQLSDSNTNTNASNRSDDGDTSADNFNLWMFQNKLKNSPYSVPKRKFNVRDIIQEDVKTVQQFRNTYFEFANNILYHADGTEIKCNKISTNDQTMTSQDYGDPQFCGEISLKINLFNENNCKQMISSKIRRSSKTMINNNLWYEFLNPHLSSCLQCTIKFKQQMRQFIHEQLGTYTKPPSGTDSHNEAADEKILSNASSFLLCNKERNVFQKRKKTNNPISSRNIKTEYERKPQTNQSLVVNRIPSKPILSFISYSLQIQLNKIKSTLEDRNRNEVGWSSALFIVSGCVQECIRVFEMFTLKRTEQTSSDDEDLQQAHQFEGFQAYPDPVIDSCNRKCDDRELSIDVSNRNESSNFSMLKQPLKDLVNDMGAHNGFHSLTVTPRTFFVSQDSKGRPIITERDNHNAPTNGFRCENLMHTKISSSDLVDFSENKNEFKKLKRSDLPNKLAVTQGYSNVTDRSFFIQNARKSNQEKCCNQSNSRHIPEISSDVDESFSIPELSDCFKEQIKHNYLEQAKELMTPVSNDNMNEANDDKNITSNAGPPRRPQRGASPRGGPPRGAPMRGGPARGGPPRGGPQRGRMRGPRRGAPRGGSPQRGGHTGSVGYMPDDVDTELVDSTNDSEDIVEGQQENIEVLEASPSNHDSHSPEESFKDETQTEIIERNVSRKQPGGQSLHDISEFQREINAASHVSDIKFSRALSMKPSLRAIPENERIDHSSMFKEREIIIIKEPGSTEKQSVLRSQQLTTDEGLRQTVKQSHLPSQQFTTDGGLRQTTKQSHLPSQQFTTDKGLRQTVKQSHLPSQQFTTDGGLRQTVKQSVLPTQQFPTDEGLRQTVRQSVLPTPQFPTDEGLRHTVRQSVLRSQKFSSDENHGKAAKQSVLRSQQFPSDESLRQTVKQSVLRSQQFPSDESLRHTLREKAINRRLTEMEYRSLVSSRTPTKSLQSSPRSSQTKTITRVRQKSLGAAKSIARNSNEQLMSRRSNSRSLNDLTQRQSMIPTTNYRTSRPSYGRSSSLPLLKPSSLFTQHHLEDNHASSLYQLNNQRQSGIEVPASLNIPPNRSQFSSEHPSFRSLPYAYADDIPETDYTQRTKGQQIRQMNQSLPNLYRSYPSGILSNETMTINEQRKAAVSDDIIYVNPIENPINPNEQTAQNYHDDNQYYKNQQPPFMSRSPTPIISPKKSSFRFPSYRDGRKMVVNKESIRSPTHSDYTQKAQHSPIKSPFYSPNQSLRSSATSRNIYYDNGSATVVNPSNVQTFYNDGYASPNQHYYLNGEGSPTTPSSPNHSSTIITQMVDANNPELAVPYYVVKSANIQNEQAKINSTASPLLRSVDGTVKMTDGQIIATDGKFGRSYDLVVTPSSIRNSNWYQNLSESERPFLVPRTFHRPLPGQQMTTETQRSMSSHGAIRYESVSPKGNHNNLSPMGSSPTLETKRTAQNTMGFIPNRRQTSNPLSRTLEIKSRNQPFFYKNESRINPTFPEQPQITNEYQSYRPRLYPEVVRGAYPSPQSSMQQANRLPQHSHQNSPSRPNKTTSDNILYAQSQHSMWPPYSIPPICQQYENQHSFAQNGYGIMGSQSQPEIRRQSIFDTKSNYQSMPLQPFQTRYPPQQTQFIKEQQQLQQDYHHQQQQQNYHHQQQQQNYHHQQQQQQWQQLQQHLQHQQCLQQQLQQPHQLQQPLLVEQYPRITQQNHSRSVLSPFQQVDYSSSPLNYQDEQVQTVNSFHKRPPLVPIATEQGVTYSAPREYDNPIKQTLSYDRPRQNVNNPLQLPNSPNAIDKQSQYACTSPNSGRYTTQQGPGVPQMAIVNEQINIDNTILPRNNDQSRRVECCMKRNTIPCVGRCADFISRDENGCPIFHVANVAEDQTDLMIANALSYSDRVIIPNSNVAQYQNMNVSPVQHGVDLILAPNYEGVLNYSNRFQGQVETDSSNFCNEEQCMINQTQPNVNYQTESNQIAHSTDIPYTQEPQSKKHYSSKAMARQNTDEHFDDEPVQKLHSSLKTSKSKHRKTSNRVTYSDESKQSGPRDNKEMVIDQITGAIKPLSNTRHFSHHIKVKSPNKPNSALNVVIYPQEESSVASLVGGGIENHPNSRQENKGVQSSHKKNVDTTYSSKTPVKRSDIRKIYGKGDIKNQKVASMPKRVSCFASISNPGDCRDCTPTEKLGGKRVVLCKFDEVDARPENVFNNTKELLRSIEEGSGVDYLSDEKRQTLLRVLLPDGAEETGSQSTSED